MAESRSDRRRLPESGETETRPGMGIARPERHDDAPAWLIQRAARLLRVLFQRAVAEADEAITPEMWQVLGRLLARDGRYQNELADATFRDRPNISRMVQGLERRGLVRRRPDPDDARRVRVHLTGKGRSALEDTAGRAAWTRDRIYAGLDREALATLRATLLRIEENAVAALRLLEDDARRGTEPTAHETAES